MRLTLPLYNAGRGTNGVSPIASRQVPPLLFETTHKLTGLLCPQEKCES